MSNQLRFALIGAGHMGAIHARVIAEHPLAHLVAVCDTDESKAFAVAKAWGAAHFLEPSKLPQVDAVIVATPTITHFSVASHFLAKGIHVLVEKPIAASLEEGEELTRIAKQSMATLMVGHSERFNPVILALKEHDISPRFIESQRVSPFSFRSADIGVVMDMMIHDIDIILSLMKSPVKSVQAVGVPVIGENEDLANARIVFENGACANATASRVALKTERVIRMFSPEMYVTLDFSKRVGRIIRRGKALSRGALSANSPELRDIKNPLEFMQKDLIRLEELQVKDAEPIVVEVDAFISCILAKGEPPVTGEDGCRALHTAQWIVEAAAESLAENRAPSSNQPPL